MELVSEHGTITKILMDFGKEMQGKMQYNLKGSNGLASGDLYQGINFSAKIMGTQFVFQLDMGVDYWKWVDEGRGAGKAPPIDGLVKWVNTKATFGGFRNVPNIRDRAVQRGLAYVIGRKIAKKGTKGNKFYSKAVTPDRLKQLQRDLSKAAAGELQTIIEHTAQGFKGLSK